MSGHSHWSTIQRQKGAADAKRGQVFTKVANMISLAARLSGTEDPSSSPRLRVALDNARSVNMPKENIQRAIDRGLGKLPGQTLEEVIYEGFGPGRVAFYLEAITDNKMRTLQEIRNLFERSGGSLGGNGSTSYMFDKKGEIITQSKGGSTEKDVLELIDLGADDIEEFEEEGIAKYRVYTQVQDLFSLSNKIAQNGYQLESSKIIYKPNLLEVIKDKDMAGKVLDLTAKLGDHPDIQSLYTNFDIPADIMFE